MATTESTAPRLPTELWSRIFTLGVEDDLRTLPILLAVNHMFQSIANRTPRLWMRLVVEIKDGHIDIPQVRSRLRRSGVLPLDIRVFSLDTTMDPTALAKLLVLRERVARIRTLEVTVRSYRIAENILSVMGRHQPAPLLERLHIFYNDATFRPSQFEQHELSLRKLFDPAPRLIHISLPADPLPSIGSLPLFSRVKTIILDTNISVLQFSLDDVVTFLHCVPLLENFKFKGVDDDSFEPSSPSEFFSESMPGLVSVDVTVPGHGLDIFCQLDAPSLTHLRLDGRRPFNLNWNVAMAMMLTTALDEISSNSFLINCLELVSTKFADPERDYPWIFSGDAFPSLKSLRLECTDITDDALQLCVRRCTNLKRLELWACRGVTGAGLVQFVQGCSANFELLLDSCPNVTQEDIAILSRAVKVESKCNVFSDCIEYVACCYFPWAFNSGRAE